MTQQACFPLALVRDVLAVKKGATTDPRLVDRFGYIRARRMTPAVVFSKRDLSRTYCGSLPLVAWVGFAYSSRAWNTSQGCYINTAGEHVYPG
jgi:hypothetical protein